MEIVVFCGKTHQSEKSVINICICVCEADLSRGLNTPDKTEKDDTPGHSQAAQDREADLSKVPNIIRDVQHLVSERQRDTDTQNIFYSEVSF